VSNRFRLAQPLPSVVRADGRGRPLFVDGRSVDAIRESWLVEDRWWTDEPVRRRYWEIVTARGELLIVFRDLRERASIGGAKPPTNVPGAPDSGGWYRQR
jgi:hypothetical protein